LCREEKINELVHSPSSLHLLPTGVLELDLDEGETINSIVRRLGSRYFSDVTPEAHGSSSSQGSVVIRQEVLLNNFVRTNARGSHSL
jgi:hypothetical protein